MAFTPRLNSSGIAGSRYWYSDNPFYQSGYGMPNCTCYAWGRWWEITGGNTPPVLSLGNGRNWWGYTQDGHRRGQKPELGAIICFGGYGDDPGHVGVVEVINPDGSIITSNSQWAGTFFYTITLRPPNYYQNPNIYFQGFIYNDAVPTTRKLGVWAMGGLIRKKRTEGKTWRYRYA